MPTPHPPEFRRRAVELARQGEKSVAVLAKDLGISESCLRNWMAQADVDDNGSSTVATSGEKAELARLRRHARQLEQENARRSSLTSRSSSRIRSCSAVVVPVRWPWSTSA